MRNESTEFKVLLKLLPLEDQVVEIECVIDDMIKDNSPYF